LLDELPEIEPSGAFDGAGAGACSCGAGKADLVDRVLCRRPRAAFGGFHVTAGDDLDWLAPSNVNTTDVAQTGTTAQSIDPKRFAGVGELRHFGETLSRWKICRSRCRAMTRTRLTAISRCNCGWVM